jgi:monofunctional biosynthetic peptidoglycan transglycosylase
LISVAICLGAGTTEAQPTGGEAGPPNIVFILADDLGWGDISIHGGSIPTPNIDKLFEQGVEFENFMGWTVCSPSRAMFLTGRHPFRLGMGPETGGELETAETTIAEAFRAQGYRTGVFGKWHNGKAPDTPEFRAAYEEALAGRSSKQFESGPGANAHGFDEAWVFYRSAGDYFTRKPHKRAGPVDWWHNLEYRPQDEGYTDDLITQRALEFIHDNRSRPFFCFVSLHLVHAPLQAKPKDIARVPPTVTDEKQRLYGAMLLATDDNVRQLLAELEKLGLDDNTIVVFSSDNGASQTGSNEPFKGSKHSLYEGGIRLPTAIRWPRGGLIGGEKWEGLWGLLDLFPTLVDMAGLQMPATRPMDGLNVWPAIRERGQSPVDSYYWVWRRNDTIRTAEWKLHRFFDRDELFNIRTDVGETVNLANQEPAVVTALKSKMNEWASSLGAGLPHQAPPEHLNASPAPAGEVLEVSVTVTHRARRSKKLVVPIAEFAGRQVATDFVEFDICAAPGSLTRGFFYSPFRKKKKRKELEFRAGIGIDQFGREQALGPAPRGGDGVWEHRIVGLLGGAPGPLLNHGLVFVGKKAGNFRVYLDNLRVRHADGSTTPIWQDHEHTRFVKPAKLPAGFADLSVRGVQLADLQTTIDDRYTGTVTRSAKNPRSKWLRKLLAIGFAALALVIAFRVFTWPDVRSLILRNPESTAFIDGARSRGISIRWNWVQYDDISDNLKRAVLVGEDLSFFSHNGFDTHELRVAAREAVEGKRLRGASTISQQLVKNLWLSSSRSPLRKLEEAVLTWQVERRLSKKRILELYLNVVEFGPGVFGADAAAGHYFDVSAALLDRHQAAQLAASLPRPSSWHPGSTSRGYAKAVDRILNLMDQTDWLDRLL